MNIHINSSPEDRLVVKQPIDELNDCIQLIVDIQRLYEQGYVYHRQRWMPIVVSVMHNIYLTYKRIYLSVQKASVKQGNPLPEYHQS